MIDTIATTATDRTIRFSLPMRKNFFMTMDVPLSEPDAPSDIVGCVSIDPHNGSMTLIVTHGGFRLNTNAVMQRAHKENDHMARSWMGSILTSLAKSPRLFRLLQVRVGLEFCDFGKGKEKEKREREKEDREREVERERENK